MRGKMASEALKCSINVSFSGCGFLGKLFNLCFLKNDDLQKYQKDNKSHVKNKSEQNLQDSLKSRISNSDLTTKIDCGLSLRTRNFFKSQ